MATNIIGPKIGIEGEAEFRKAIEDINASLKTLDSELQVNASMYDEADKSAENLSKQNEILTRSIEEQKNRLEQLQKGLEKSKDEYGELDSKTQKWQQAVNKATAELNKTEKQLDKNSQVMAEASNVTETYQEQIKKLDEKMAVLQSDLKLARSEYDSSSESAGNLAKQAEDLTEIIAQQSKKVEILTDELKKSIRETGEDSIETRKLQREVNEAKAELNGMTKQLEKTNDQLKESIRTTEKSSVSFKDLKTTLENANPSIVAIGAAAVAAAKKIIDISTAAAAAADEINTLSKETGMSTDDIQKFRYASELVDVSFDKLANSLAKTVQSMKKAEEGSGDAADAFSELGVNIRDASGHMRSAEDVFFDVIDALGKVGNETERDALSMELFGRKAQELNPLILGGAEALRQIGAEAEKFGLILSQEKLDTLNAMNDEIDQMKATLEQLGMVFSQGIAQSATPTLQELNQMLMENAEAVETLGNLVGEIVNFLSSMFLPVIRPIADSIKQINDAIKELNGLIEKLTGKKSAVSDFFGVLGQLATPFGFSQALVQPFFGYDTGTFAASPGPHAVAETAPEMVISRGRAAVVSEPSVVNFGGGEQVLNPSQTRTALQGGGQTAKGGDTYYITVNMDISQLRDVQELIDKVKKSRLTRRAK